MFEGIGKNVVDGAMARIKELANQFTPEKGEALFAEFVGKIPLLGDIKKGYDTMSDAEKSEFWKNVLIFAAKIAANSGGKASFGERARQYSESMWVWFLNLFRGKKKQFPPAQYRTAHDIAINLAERDFKGLGKWLTSNLTWDADYDPIDDFKPVNLTLAEGHGDCEDFAMVAQAVLRLWNIEDNYILGVMSTKSGHAVSIFRTAKGQPWMMYTNGEYKVGPVKFADVVAWVAKDTGYRTVEYWQIYYPADVDGNYNTPDVDTADKCAVFTARMDE